MTEGVGYKPDVTAEPNTGALANELAGGAVGATGRIVRYRLPRYPAESPEPAPAPLVSSAESIFLDDDDEKKKSRNWVGRLMGVLGLSPPTESKGSFSAVPTQPELEVSTNEAEVAAKSNEAVKVDVSEARATSSDAVNTTNADVFTEDQIVDQQITDNNVENSVEAHNESDQALPIGSKAQEGPKSSHSNNNRLSGSGTYAVSSQEKPVQLGLSTDRQPTLRENGEPLRSHAYYGYTEDLDQRRWYEQQQARRMQQMRSEITKLKTDRDKVAAKSAGGVMPRGSVNAAALRQADNNGMDTPRSKQPFSNMDAPKDRLRTVATANERVAKYGAEQATNPNKLNKDRMNVGHRATNAENNKAERTKSATKEAMIKQELARTEAQRLASEALLRQLSQREQDSVSEIARELSHEHKDADRQAASAIGWLQSKHSARTSNARRLQSAAVLRTAAAVLVTDAQTTDKTAVKTASDDKSGMYKRAATSGFVTAIVIIAIILVLLLLQSR